ncbi:MAG: hypothetical protein U9Q85_02995 [Patescibacteria group bacterium]|nr:hypothetical protein [Patescibacteria group bacterium]
MTETTYDNFEDEYAQAAELGRQKHGSRQSKVASTMNKSGIALRGAGVAGKVGGKATKYAGKATKSAGKAATRGGTEMMAAGAGMSTTIVGALAGVPLMAAGGLVAGAGVGAQAAGTGMEKTGKATEKASKVAKNAGKRLQKKSKKIGAVGSLMDKLKSDEDEEKGNKMKALISGGTKLATGWGLRWSWGAVSFWGLGIIPLNVFAFLGLILPSAFPRVGEEWPKFHPFGHKIVEQMAFVLIDVIVIMLLFVLIQLLTGGMDTDAIDAIQEATKAGA